MCIYRVCVQVFPHVCVILSCLCTGMHLCVHAFMHSFTKRVLSLLDSDLCQVLII